MRQMLWADPLTGMPSLREVEQAAMGGLPPGVYDFVAGGSGEERALRANREAFEQCHVVPRVLTDVSACRTRTTLLGEESSAPVAIAPMAYQGLLHPEGERALAAAARDAGLPYVAATLSSYTVEEIAAVGAVTWFQLYWLRDRARTAELIERAEAANCRVLMLTVDVPRMGRRLRDIGNAFALPRGLGPANLAADTRTEHVKVMGRSAVAEHALATLDPSLDWSALSWIRQRTGMRLVLKGVLDPADARRAADEGVDGIVVSNHGGRQLDAALPSLAALPAVREAVGDRYEILLDSGVRSGEDVLRALALGASGVLLGRPALWGLALGGRRGAAHVLALLQTELEQALVLAGCPDVAAAVELRTEERR